jgi:polyphenol oxidase
METIIVTTNGDLDDEDDFELRSGDGTTWLTCVPFEAEGFTAAFSTRDGAKEGETSTDTARRLLTAMGRPGAAIVTCRQVHSSKVRVVKTREETLLPETECDAMTAIAEGLLLGVKTADCVPVLIADTKTRAIAAIHAGWRGTIDRIVERAFAMMIGSWKTHRDDCIAAIGPAICGGCYEVGTEVYGRFQAEFPYGERLVSDVEGEKGYLDLKLANLIQLELCGIQRGRIFMSDQCTVCDNDLYFSYRREGARAGRVVSLIGN